MPLAHRFIGGNGGIASDQSWRDVRGYRAGCVANVPPGRPGCPDFRPHRSIGGLVASVPPGRNVVNIRECAQNTTIELLRRYA